MTRYKGILDITPFTSNRVNIRMADAAELDIDDDIMVLGTPSFKAPGTKGFFGRKRCYAFG
jgi:hypothetical protein